MTKEQKNQTLIELKAQAYDAIANKEHWQRKLQEINNEISRVSGIQTKEVTEDEMVNDDANHQ